MTWIAVLLGGALGSGARHGVNIAAARLLGSAAPFGTATVNMVGSLCIGLLAGAIAAQRVSMSASLRVFVFVGILGGFTTFSSFMLDSLTLLEGGMAARAAVNLVGQLLFGFCLVYAGYRLGLMNR
jgi:CrcB protein